MSEGGAAAEVGLLQLPPELLHVVLEYCSALDLVRCRQSCTALRTAGTERTLWRALAAKDYGLDDADTATTPWNQVYEMLAERVLTVLTPGAQVPWTLRSSRSSAPNGR